MISSKKDILVQQSWTKNSALLKMFHPCYCPRTSHSPWWRLEYTVNTFFFSPCSLLQVCNTEISVAPLRLQASLWAVKLQAVDQFGKILWCQECNAKKRRGEDLNKQDLKNKSNFAYNTGSEENHLYWFNRSCHSAHHQEVYEGALEKVSLAPS